jgi:excisionase family DNA binding protein
MRRRPGGWPIPSKEAADLLGVSYYSVYRLVQRGKLKACRALRGKLLVPRSELLRLLKTE